MLAVGAVGGCGSTVIAIVPNPADVALLKRSFVDATLDATGLPLGAPALASMATALMIL